MTEHLTSQEVTDWRSGVSGAEEILRLDDHLAECAECRSRVSLDRTSRIQALQSEFSQPHLTESELDDYAGLRPISADSMQHLEICEACRADADDLRQFAEANRSETETPTINKSPSEPVSIRRNQRPWLRPLAAILVFGVVGLSVWRALDKQHAAPPAAPVQVAAAIPPQYLSEVNAAVDTGTLHIPAAISGLTSGPIQLRSADKPPAASAFHVLSPVATGVVEDTPQFQWTPVEGATYSISIYDDQFQAVANATSLKVTVWRPEKPLARGMTYRWEVRAIKGGRTGRAPAQTDPEARFTVLPAADADRLTAARAAMPAEPLAMGILYANAGALDNAKHELSNAISSGTPEQKSAATRLLTQLK